MVKKILSQGVRELLNWDITSLDVRMLKWAYYSNFKSIQLKKMSIYTTFIFCSSFKSIQLKKMSIYRGCQFTLLLSSEHILKVYS